MATETDTKVTFVREDAPAAKRGRKSIWAERLAPLVEMPNEEYRIVGVDFKNASAAARVANGLNTGKLAKPEAPGTWQFKSRTILGDNGPEYALYGMYLAPKSNGKAK